MDRYLMYEIFLKDLKYNGSSIVSKNYIWVNPKKIKGLNIAKTKKILRDNFFKKFDIDEEIEEQNDEIILDYLIECINIETCYGSIKLNDFVDAMLFLICDLNSSYTAYNNSENFKLFLEKHDKELNKLFQALKKRYINETDEHVINLLRIFICDIFQYGKEWGKNSLYRYNKLTSSNLLYLKFIEQRKTKSLSRYKY